MPAPPAPDAFVLRNKPRKMELTVFFDSQGYVRQVLVNDGCGIPRLDRDTVSFIQHNWRRTDLEGKQMIVPIIYNPPPTMPLPWYPREAADKGLSGTVFFTVDFDRDGDVMKVTVTQSSGHRELDDGLVDFVKDHWRFPPVPDTQPRVREVRTSRVFIFQPGPSRRIVDDDDPEDLERRKEIDREGVDAAHDGDFVKAKACFDELLAEKPNSTLLQLQYGSLLFEEGNYQGALSRWQGAFATEDSVSLNDRPPLVKFIYMALAYWAMGDKVNAFAQCSAAARIYSGLYSLNPPVRFFDHNSEKMGEQMFKAWYRSEHQ
jgi:TonB family protein